MFTLLHESETATLPGGTPAEVMDRISENLRILDMHYGADRGVNDYGGCVVYVPHGGESDEDWILQKITGAPPESVDVVKTAEADYIHALYMLGSDYGIVLIMAENSVPARLRDELKRHL